MQLYHEFMRKHGIINASHLKVPRNKGEEFILPPAITVNYINFNVFEVGLNRSEPGLASFEGKVYSNDIRELTHRQGKISHRANKLDAALRQYYKRNITVRMARNIDRLMDDNRIIIINNYAPLNQTNNFTPSITREYDMWESYYRTMIKQVKNSRRQQFIRIPISDLPDIATFKLLLSRGITRSELGHRYTNKGLYTLLALFKALMPELTESGPKDNYRFNLFNDFSQPDNINFYIAEGTQWSVFNLTTLRSLVKGDGFVAEFFKLFEYYLDLKNSTMVPEDEEDMDGIEVEEDDAKFLSEQKRLLQTDNSRLNKTLGVTALNSEIERMGESGQLTTANKKRLQRICEKHANIPSFSNNAATLAELADLSKVDMTIHDHRVRKIAGVADPSMLKKTVRQLDKEYVERVMDSHIAASILSIQKMGVAVTDTKETKFSDASENWRQFNIQLTPLTGKPKTSAVRIPAVDTDGTWKSGGTQYRTSKVRGEFPIVKVAPNRVAVTTNTGKTFITRSAKVTDNLDTFIARQLTLIAEDNNNEAITGLNYGNCLDTKVSLPRIYSSISKRYEGIKTKGQQYRFVYKDIPKHFPDWKETEDTKGLIPIGRRGDAHFAMDFNGDLFKVEKEITPMGPFLEHLTIDMDKCPSEYANAKLAGKDVPIILILGYLGGLKKTLRRLEVRTEIIEGRITGELPPGMVIKFRNSHLWIADEGNNHKLITNGLKAISRFARDYDLEDLDRPEIYQVIFENLKLSARHLDEAFIFNRMLIDPITEDILNKHKLPVDFDEILVYCAKLLNDDAHLSPKSIHALRTKGYERFSAAICREMMVAARQYHRSSKNANTVVQIHPKSVWSTIVMDPAGSPVESSNPLHNMKERSLVTFSGFDGRNGRMLNWEMRKFDVTEVGVFGEASPDSSKVGTANYLTPAANINSLYGDASMYKGDGTESAELLTAIAALLPCIDQDDMKRINFGSIQASARDVAVGYEVSPVGTGFDVAMGHQVDKMWAWPASQDGKVTKLTEDVMEVTYKDGTKETNRVGKIVGVKSGKFKPRNTLTRLKLGQTFKADDILTFNSDFFGEYQFDKSQVCFKLGKLVNVAYVETNDTLEDSSTISEDMVTGCACPVIKTRDIVSTTDKAITNLVTLGSEVHYRQPLCAISEDTGLEDDDILSQLSGLAAEVPKSEDDGVIVGIEVRYNGLKENMSPSIRKIVNAYDKRQAKIAADLGGGAPTSGYIKDGLRLQGKVLAPNSVHIRIMTEKLLYEGVGDKGGVANQLKTVHGRIMSAKNILPNGERIGMLFGGKSDQARVVNSPLAVGTTIVLLKLGTAESYRMYKEG